MPSKYSVIVPVYNRPQEVEELLTSLVHQTFHDFDVIIIDDGSTEKCEDTVLKFAGELQVSYYFKLNSGPGPSRNFGFERALGSYFVVFDSDCIIPPGYFQAVEDFLQSTTLDAWGGPDRGSAAFTPIQQAMAYTMSSVLTTGGIRGGASTGFQPRSFNMGITRRVFNETKGFQFDRLAEDIEFSIRMKTAGYRVGLIPGAFVFHKRRTNFRQFFRQVSGFGKGRVLVGRAHPGAIKATHWFPALFFCGIFAIPFLFFFALPAGFVAIGAYLVYLLLIGLDAFRITRSAEVAVLSIPAAIVQLNGYGSGFLKELFRTGI